MKHNKFLITSLLALVLISCTGNNPSTSFDNSSSSFQEELVSSSDDIISLESSDIIYNISSENENSNYSSVDTVSSIEQSINESSSEELSFEEHFSSENISNDQFSEDILSSEEILSDYYSEDILSSDELSSEEISSDSFDQISSEEYSSSEDLPIITSLEIPNLKINEDNGVVSWEKIDNATHYNYIINDSEVKSTTSLTLELDNESTISVQAASDDLVSSWSYAVTYFDTSDVEIEPTKDIYVYFHNSNINPISIKSGEKITKPSDPIKQNYTFENWYSDPFYQDVFDFSTPVYESTILYANYIEDDLIKNTYFWMKANEKISSSTIGNTSSSGWKFIPLKRNENQNKFIEFYTTITVSNASSSDPAYFLVMDGFDDNNGRTYWKYNGNDFSITSNGIYNIYFSLENQYMINGVVAHAYYQLADNTSLKYANNNIYGENTLSTPNVVIDGENNLATWDEIENATSYEVIINNKTPKLINENYVSINKSEHITVRALSIDSYSNWSIPKANINYVIKEDIKTHAYVYFFESNTPALKVKIGEQINQIENPSKDGYTFDGWYKDITLKEKVNFPYTVLENTIFYPKWTYNLDYTTHIYYELFDSNDNKISGLTWNLDNYDFDEYETGSVLLKSSESYYIKPVDGDSTYGPYTVDSDGTYKIYFSEDYVWNANTENETHVYIQSEKLTIYFTNNKFWSGTIRAYMWNSSTNKYATAWPGSAMEYAKTNSYGQNIYKVDVDTSLYDYIIFTDGSNQTNDIPLIGVASGTGFYITDGRNYGTYTYA